MSDEESVVWDLKEIRSKDPDVKWTAVNNLSKYLQSNPKNFRARMIVKSFLSMINDPSDNIRETIYSTLITCLTDSKGLESLIFKGLTDSSPSIRSLSLEWLHTSNHDSVTSQTVKFLQDSSDAVKKTAMDIVLARDIKNIENQLLELLKNEKGVLRRSVIFALGKMKTTAAIDALTMIMRNPEFDDWTRNQASSALEHMGGTDLIIPYIENLIDTNEYVRQTAAAFLMKNEKELESLIVSNQRLDYLAFLQYATDTTKQDFSSTINNLTTQMSSTLQTLASKLQEKYVLVLNELTSELNIDPIAIKIIIDKFLNIKLFPQPEGRYFTKKGLKQILRDQ
ncbi:MAG: HEAT repeat domain-containing protein, partial [Candidatus Hodarchaeales archaeon]